MLQCVSLDHSPYRDNRHGVAYVKGMGVASASSSDVAWCDRLHGPSGAIQPDQQLRDVLRHPVHRHFRIIGSCDAEGVQGG